MGETLGKREFWLGVLFVRFHKENFMGWMLEFEHNDFEVGGKWTCILGDFVPCLLPQISHLTWNPGAWF